MCEGTSFREATIIPLYLTRVYEQIRFKAIYDEHYGFSDNE